MGNTWDKQETPARYRRGERFRMRQEEYDRRIAAGCVICGSREQVQVDHDHTCCGKQRSTCGKCVRGVLCRRHNVVLGFVKDDPATLRALAEYVESYKHPEDAIDE